MNSQLRQCGVRFLKQLGRHADAIMEAYVAGAVNEQTLDAKQVDKLLQEGIVYRPQEGADLHLRRTIRALLEEALKDDRNRQVETNTGSAIATFKTLTAHYQEAREQSNYAAADAYLQDLREHVYSFAETLAHSIRVLWSRINNEFGYVGTINAKIRENELAQAQVSELLSGLEAIDFAQITDLAGDVRELRRLLVTHLQQTISDCAQELSIVQGRLLTLLGRFRKIRGRTRLLKGWLLYMDQHPDYQVGNHVAQQHIPQLFNQATALLQPASINIHNSGHEPALMDIAAYLKAQPQSSLAGRQAASAEAVTLTPAEQYEVTRQPINIAVDDYFCQVIDSAQAVSALEYLHQQQLPWDEESWLYQVIGGYEGLPADQRSCFELSASGEPDPTFSGNFIIRDVSLWLA